jgi:hypothetical protein
MNDINVSLSMTYPNGPGLGRMGGCTLITLPALATSLSILIDSLKDVPQNLGFWNQVGWGSLGIYSQRHIYISFNLSLCPKICNLEQGMVFRWPTKNKCLLLVTCAWKSLTIDNLKKRGIQGPNWCVMCRKIEEIGKHLFMDSLSQYRSGTLLFQVYLI